jgi:hypothetical protein
LLSVSRRHGVGNRIFDRSKGTKFNPSRETHRGNASTAEKFLASIVRFRDVYVSLECEEPEIKRPEKTDP